MQQGISPIATHFSMQEILVDGSEFVRQNLIQKFNDTFFGFHEILLA
jgi:hypothetical protein